MSSITTTRRGDLLKYVINDIADPSQDLITTVGWRFSMSQGQGAGAYSPDLNLFVRTTPSFAYWDLNRAGSRNKNVNFTPEVTDAEFSDVYQGHYGLDYDPIRRRFTLWSGYGDVWHLKPPNIVSADGWTLDRAPSPQGSTPTTGPGTGVLGKWKYLPGYDVFAGVTDSRSGDVWVYKPVDKGLSIIPQALPNASLGTSYSFSFAARDGQPPFDWSLSAGELPPGLFLEENGMLSGTPVAAGRYDFAIMVTDQAGDTAIADASITVEVPNVMPTADFSYACVGRDCSFTDNSSDSDGTLVAWAWDFGDGAGAQTQDANHSYASGGTYTVILAVTDDAGASVASAPVSVTVSPSGGTHINVAAQSNGAVVSGSSFYNAGYPLAAVNNGDRKGLNWGAGGGWNDATGDAYPDWVEIAFAGSASVSAVNVFTLQDNYASPVAPTEVMSFSKYGITAFEVQYWNGSGWVTVPGGSVTGNNKVWRRFTFPAVTTDRIRVVVNGALAGYSRIVEIEAYGTVVGAGNTPPSVQLTAPSDNAVYTAPATLTLTAAAADSDGTVSHVEFYAGTTLLGTDATAPYGLDWDNVAAGQYVLTAKAYDDAGASTVSAPLNVTVSPPGGT